MLAVRTRRRNVTINLRADQNQRALIDRAAGQVGTSRSNFMLEAACREATVVLADRRNFLLEEREHRKFTAALDKSPVANPRLRRLLASRSPWE